MLKLHVFINGKKKHLNGERNNMGLYEPAIEKMRIDEIRAKRKAKRMEKARIRKEKREKYKIMYKEELSKERAKLQAQKEKDIEVYKTKRAIQKAHDKARSRVKPFTPSTMFKMPSKRLTPEQKRKLKKAGVDVGKTTVKLGKTGLSILDSLYGGGKGGLKITKKRSPTRKYKKKTPTRKYKKKTTKRKTTKRKSKTYYCHKCKQRHAYSSKIGKKHRRK